MGRIAAFTQEQVFEAANKLVETGNEVSPNSLRDLLGRGSYSTFVKHIEAWQRARQEAPAPVIIEMPENVKTAFTQCWQAASAEAGKEIAAIREKADAEVRAAKRSVDEALAAIEQLEAEAEADATKQEALEQELAKERAALAQTTSEGIARESALSATVAQMREQIASQEAELVRVHRESDDLRSQLIEAQERIDTVSARERKLIEEVAHAKADVSRLTEDLKRQKAQSVEAIGKIERGKQALEAELMGVRREVRDMDSQLGQANGELQALRTQVVSQAAAIEKFSALPGHRKANEES